MRKDELIQLVKDNIRHPKFGQLIAWYTTPLIYHPSIQLNDEISLGWEPQVKLRPNYLGRIAVRKNYARKEIPAEGHKGKPFVYEALLRSCEKIHNKMSYNLWTLNCEHWATGVATGTCYSTQLFMYQRPMLALMRKNLWPEIETVNEEVSQLIRGEGA
jgi:hypothetical protein